jgi:hypothetical protein
MDAGLRAEPSPRKLDISGEPRLIRTEVIPEFEIRARINASGPWTLPAREVLRVFDRSRMTDRARIEIAEALEYADLVTDPPIRSVDPDGQITIRRASREAAVPVLRKRCCNSTVASRRAWARGLTAGMGSETGGRDPLVAEALGRSPQPDRQTDCRPGCDPVMGGGYWRPKGDRRLTM